MYRFSVVFVIIARAGKLLQLRVANPPPTQPESH